MLQLYDFLIKPYSNYSPLQIGLECFAVFFSIWSVILAKKNHVGLYPTGIIGSAIYVFLLYQWSLFGDLIISFYYVVMSFYGWISWKKKDTPIVKHEITFMKQKDKIVSIIIFFVSIIFVSVVYFIFDKFNFWWAYLDTFITGLFFVGMWLLTQRKVENWSFLLAGNLLAIPLFFIKGLALTGLLYIFLSSIAILGYQSWKEIARSKTTV